jgi:hypothetical protein
MVIRGQSRWERFHYWSLVSDMAWDKILLVPHFGED